MKSEEFRQKREETLRLTQDELAKRLGVTRRTIIRIEQKPIVPAIYAEALRGLAMQAAE